MNDHNAHTELFRRIQSRAADNMRLVYLMVNKWIAWSGREDLREEAVSQGMLTLARAANLFNENLLKSDGKPIKFSTYACDAIKKNLWRLREELERGNRVSGRGRVRIKDNHEGDERDPLATAADRDCEAMDKADDFEQLRYLMGFLDDRRREVVAAKWLRGMNLNTTAWAFGVTRSRIGQIERDAIGIMRRAAERDESKSL